MYNDYKSVDQWIKHITSCKNKKALMRTYCEWIVLRPNDDAAWLGEKNFRNKVKAVETLLDTEEYINSELRKYYYDMKDHEHSFHDFDRWKIYGRKR